MGFTSDDFEFRSVPGTPGVSDESIGLYNKRKGYFVWLAKSDGGNPRLALGSPTDPLAALCSMFPSALGEFQTGDGAGSVGGSLQGRNVSTTQLATATAPTVTPQTAGGTTWTYLVQAKLVDGSYSPASPTGTSAAGCADIRVANQGNVLAWTAVPGAYSYDIYRTVAGGTPNTTGKIANVVGAVTYTDAGVAGDTTTAPVLNTTGMHKILGRFGESCNFGSLTEQITLSTGGLTTDSVAKLLPANSVILCVVARVTTTITTTTSWALGDGSTPARFRATDSTLTVGQAGVGIAHWTGTAMQQVAAASLRITCTGANPGAGVVRVTTFFLTGTAPTS